jgi:hypothetical protein
VLSATVNLADRRRLSTLIAASAALAGATNLLVPLLVHDLTQAPPGLPDQVRARREGELSGTE